MHDWNSLFSEACPIALQLGPYIGTRHEVAIKLIRLLNIFYSDEEAQRSIPDIAEGGIICLEYEFHFFLLSAHNTIMVLCDSVLVPAASLLESNFAYCEELWQILGRFPYQDRYR